uniref:Ribonuclease H-like domain-containing protein n=1 Tax=Tanacetum cinerariifolium TaxID=118510 RepID=A0A699KZT4_TANCI|nr:ribonuclease H-like domain-containing protein [Tanacetum cinerariifolium]
MDLFCPTSVSSIVHKKYCLVITDDFSRFTWVFFLATKDETSRILKSFITKIENLVEKKVKTIRCDNGIEFKNRVMNEFCKEKGIKREYNVARTPRQNRVAERINKTLIEAAWTMLADSKLPTTFWAEAVSTACYVKNRVLVVKPHFKTPYELFKASDSHNKDKHGPSQASESDNHERPNAKSSTKTVNTAGPVNTNDYPNDPLMPNLEDTGIFDDAYDDRDEGAEADYNNLEIVISVSHISSTRIHKDHPKEYIIGEVEAMQEELLQFKLLNVWTLVDLPPRKRAIGTKWVYRNKRDQRGIVVRNKARLVTQGHRQEEGINYDEVFAPVARIKAIRLFIAYASFMDFTVYQMDVKSAFLYGTIEEDVYISQPSGFVDPEFLNRV